MLQKIVDKTEEARTLVSYWTIFKGGWGTQHTALGAESAQLLCRAVLGAKSTKLLGSIEWKGVTYQSWMLKKYKLWCKCNRKCNSITGFLVGNRNRFFWRVVIVIVIDYSNSIL